jgi:hypothetical protein
MVPAGARPSLTRAQHDVIIVVAALVAHALYLIVAGAGFGRFGYPLDDAWIHQTYARNVTVRGEWAFVPGVPSTGSTSILWTLVLVPAHLIPVDPRVCTHLLGALTLVAAALGASRLVGDEHPRMALWAGLAVALEWHLAWAGASGMETGLFAALLIWFWVWAARRSPAQAGHRWQDGALIGLWGGVLMLCRPEGLLAPALFGVYGLFAGKSRIGQRLLWSAAAAGGLAALVAPFFGFNYALSGSILPNTFFAKQTEYAVLWGRPYLVRLAEQVGVVCVGAQAVLLPGLLADIWRRVRSKPVELPGLLPIVWAIMHLALYAARLPVIYQHGRYAMPVIPVLVACAVRGALGWARPRSQQPVVRLASRAWLLSSALLFPLTLAILGAPAYGRDVDFVEQEMVAAARWVADHTGPDAVIAAHDIGALGYFAPRELVDLAGLASPEVVPFMTDPDRLADYILERRSDLLIVFPHWSQAYERMVAGEAFTQVWSAAEGEGYVVYSDLGPMTVYAVRP